MTEKERLQAVAVICFGLGAVTMGFVIYVVLKVLEAVL